MVGSLRAGLRQASHVGWWIITGCGLAVLLVGLVTTGRWARGTAARPRRLIRDETRLPVASARGAAGPGRPRSQLAGGRAGQLPQVSSEKAAPWSSLTTAIRPYGVSQGGSRDPAAGRGHGGRGRVGVGHREVRRPVRRDLGRAGCRSSPIPPTSVPPSFERGVPEAVAGHVAVLVAEYGLVEDLVAVQVAAEVLVPAHRARLVGQAERRCGPGPARRRRPRRPGRRRPPSARRPSRPTAPSAPAAGRLDLAAVSSASSEAR